MLKFFFWVLLLANAGLFAWQQGHLDSLVPSDREPARLDNQLNADKVAVIPPPAPAVAPSPPAEETVPAPVPPQAAPKPEVIACTEVGNFNRQDAAQFEARLAAASFGKAERRPIREVATHIVYIPPLPDLEAAERKVAELRRLGVTDYYIIQDNSPLRMGISLGVFKQQEAAREHLARMNQRGVRSARIGERSVTTSMVAFQLRDLSPENREALTRLAANFPRSQVRACESN